MKYLRQFNEKSKVKKQFSDEEIENITKEITDISYIVEDEGYKVEIHQPYYLAGLQYFTILIRKSIDVRYFKTIEVEEFIDRLKENLSEFNISYPSKDGKYPIPYSSAPWSELKGDWYMTIYINQKEIIINESVIDKSDILDIIQELVDNGFKSKIQICYCSEDFSPFKSMPGDMRSGYDNKHPGKQSFTEFKGGLKSYLIKLTYKDGVEFEEFENCHSMFIEALDRLEELGKVFKKVHITTDAVSGLIKPTFEILIISKEKSESNLKDQFIKLLKDNGVNVPFVKGSYYNDYAHRIYIPVNSDTSSIKDWNKPTPEIKERSKKYYDLSKKIKQICKDKFKTKISHYGGRLYTGCSIEFSPWNK